MSKKSVPGVLVVGSHAYVNFGHGLVATTTYPGRVISLTRLNKPNKIGKEYKDSDLGSQKVWIHFANEKGLDVLIDSLKEVKKSFRKRKKK